MSKFHLTRDINGYNGFGLDFSDKNWSVALSLGVPQSFVIPGESEYWIVIFSYEPGATIFVAKNDTASVATGILSETSSEINPTARRVRAGDVISMITPNTTAFVGVSLYAL